MFQTGIVGLLLIAVLAAGGFYLVYKNIAGNILPFSDHTATNTAVAPLLEKKSATFNIDTPVEWLKREVRNPIENSTKYYFNSQSSTDNENSNSGQSGDNKNKNDNLNFFYQSVSSNSTSSVSGFAAGVSNSLNQTSITGEYYKKFLENTFSIGFDADQLPAVKKEENGRVLTLEELIDFARNGTSLGELKASFSAWSYLDKKVLAKMERLYVDEKAREMHKELLGWFQYHQATAQKLSAENLSSEQVGNIYVEFQQKAEKHNNQFKQYLDNPISFESVFEKIFSLFIPPRAEAFTCGALVPPPFYHFGGRVILMKPCNWGVVETVSPPCGGELLFSYPVLAGNPFLWKKPTIGSAVLGRSVVAPGICPVGIVPVFPYEAVVLYFGTSLVP